MTSVYGKCILVIDDDQAMLRALGKVLGGEGAVVTTACHAGEAVLHLTNRRERFDLVITDLRMPVVGGSTILGMVADAFPQLPVIILTAFGKPELEAECLGKGAAAFLEKPLDTPRLLAVIEEVFSSFRPGFTRRAGLRSGVKGEQDGTLALSLGGLIRPARCQGETNQRRAGSHVESPDGSPPAGRGTGEEDSN